MIWRWWSEGDDLKVMLWRWCTDAVDVIDAVTRSSWCFYFFFSYIQSIPSFLFYQCWQVFSTPSWHLLSTLSFCESKQIILISYRSVTFRFLMLITAGGSTVVGWWMGWGTTFYGKHLPVWGGYRPFGAKWAVPHQTWMCTSSFNNPHTFAILQCLEYLCPKKYNEITYIPSKSQTSYVIFSKCHP